MNQLWEILCGETSWGSLSAENQQYCLQRGSLPSPALCLTSPSHSDHSVSNWNLPLSPSTCYHPHHCSVFLHSTGLSPMQYATYLFCILSPPPRPLGWKIHEGRDFYLTALQKSQHLELCLVVVDIVDIFFFKWTEQMRYNMGTDPVPVAEKSSTFWSHVNIFTWRQTLPAFLSDSLMLSNISHDPEGKYLVTYFNTLTNAGKEIENYWRHICMEIKKSKEVDT